MRANKNDCSVRLFGRTIGLSNKITGGVSKDYVYTMHRKKKSDKRTREDIDKLIVKAVKDCKAKGKVLVLPYTIKTKSSFHANILLFNYHLKTLERYEPHGSRTGALGTKNIERIDGNMNKWIKKLNPMFEKEGLGKWISLGISSALSCPRISSQRYRGLQSLFPSQNKTMGVARGGLKMTYTDPNGWCVAWSALLLNERLKHLKLFPNEVKKKTMKILKGEGQDKVMKMLRNFAMVQYTELKKILKKMIGSTSFPPITTSQYRALILKYTLGTIEGKGMDKLKDKQKLATLKTDIKSIYEVNTQKKPTEEEVNKILDDMNTSINKILKQQDIRSALGSNDAVDSKYSYDEFFNKPEQMGYLVVKWNAVFQHFIRDEMKDAIIN